MSTSVTIKLEEFIDAEILYLEGEVESLLKRIDDLKSFKSSPKAPLYTGSSTTSGRTQTVLGGSDHFEPRAQIKAAADKVPWKQKEGSGFHWTFARNKDKSIPAANEDLIKLIDLSATKVVSDGEFDYRLSKDGTFLNKTKRGEHR